MISPNRARGIALLVLGVALWVIYRGWTLGMGVGIVVFVIGIGFLVKAREEN